MHQDFFFANCMLSVAPKETKGRSSGQTPFTIKPKQIALEKKTFNPKKILPKLIKKNHFCIKQLFSADPTM